MNALHELREFAQGLITFAELSPLSLLTAFNLAVWSLNALLLAVLVLR